MSNCVGSTIATMPSANRTAVREPGVVARALEVLGNLIGDAEPDVQKALSWAYRTMAAIDAAATTRALEAEARIAASTDDGHRAWVIRDSLSKLHPADAGQFRELLGTVRRKPNAPSTSIAAGLATRFADFHLGGPLAEPPVA